MALHLGLMSGTSVDGVDAVLAEFDSQGLRRSLAHVHRAMPEALRGELLGLNLSGPDELERAALAANALMRLYAEAAQELAQRVGVELASVTALGAHGQTVRHRPGRQALQAGLWPGGPGFTIQLVNGALLAELSGVDVVCDFRSRDVAAGGQGAPLVPAFHAATFGRPGQCVAVLNVGGIANVSLIGPDSHVQGHDTGPGNVLMDLWMQRQRGQAFDRDGLWASQGRVLAPLLEALLAEAYFAQPAPKSTGRELFNWSWLERHLPAFASAEPGDIMATLAELTARSSAAPVRGAQAAELLVCGGGAFNTHLMRRLAALLPGVPVRSTAERGVPPDEVEALAFAWLSWAFWNKKAGNVPAVTGAQGPRLLGAWYPR